MRSTPQLSMKTEVLASTSSLNYTFCVGSQNIPPTHVKFKKTDCVEPFEDLKWSFHVPGNSLVSMRTHPLSVYGQSSKTDGKGSYYWVWLRILYMWEE